VDSTSILTHELLHGLGFGADALIGKTPWDLLTNKEYFIGKETLKYNHGPVKITDDGHVEISNDLMNAFPPFEPTDISTLDSHIMHDLGLGATAPSWWHNPIEIIG
jgi:hypothetical protein